MRLNIRFCIHIYKHIRKYVLRVFFEKQQFENDGECNTRLVIFKLLLRPWDISHRVERQKLMVISREEMSVRVRKGGFVANLLLRQNFGPNFLLENW